MSRAARAQASRTTAAFPLLHVELADLNREAIEPAARIQQDFEEHSL
jgi:hypothetical protein